MRHSTTPAGKTGTLFESCRESPALADSKTTDTADPLRGHGSCFRCFASRISAIRLSATSFQTAANCRTFPSRKARKARNHAPPCHGRGALLRVRVPPSSTRFFVHFVLFVGANRSVFDRDVRGSVPRKSVPRKSVLGNPYFLGDAASRRVGDRLALRPLRPQREYSAQPRRRSRLPRKAQRTQSRCRVNAARTPHPPCSANSVVDSVPVLSRSEPSPRPSVSAEPFRVYPWS